MFKKYLKQIDGFTVAIIGSLLSITIFAIAAINYVFVDRILLNEAQVLSYNAATEIHDELFKGEGLGSHSNLAKAIESHANFNTVTHKIPSHRKRTHGSFVDGILNDANKPTFVPHRLDGDSKLQEFINTHLSAHAYMSVLDNYAIFLPFGDVYQSDSLYSNVAKRNLYSTGFSIISSVQSVFIHGRSVYAFQDEKSLANTRHFIPLKQDDKVIAVVLMEAHNTTAGIKMADAVSNAVSLTTVAGLPIVFLVMYLVWSRQQENARAKQEIEFLADHDNLTGILNRSGYYTAIEKTILARDHEADKFALFLIDVDRFHTINAELGASQADEILKTIVSRLKMDSPENATICRLSGDEFALILPDISTAEDAANTAKYLKNSLSEPHKVGEEKVVCTCSIGIAFAPDNGENGQALVKNAKLALYRSKVNGGNTFSFFEAEMDREQQRRRKLEKDLAHALTNDEFEVFYQPQIELSGQSITGYEALIRWNHPELGMVSPVDFVPVLEDTKMIVEVGEYVMRRACKEAMLWSNNEKVAVNLSPVQFAHQDIPEMVERALRDTGLPAKRLEVEITETILMSDTETAIKMLSALKKLGVSIAMDDFGTGYSSLSYISKFEFDKIKIDRSFVSSILTDERARVIITTVIGLGRALDIMITAEGIETQEQLLLIQASGCHFGQGYLFGRPVPLKQVLLDQQAAREEVARREAEIEAEAMEELDQPQVA